MFRFCFTLCLLFSAPFSASAAADLAGTAHVIDADTIDVITASGARKRVRLHGIDAPEPDQTCRTEKGLVWGCGAWASAELRARIQGRAVTCAQTDFDRKYGRIVAVCHVDGIDIGRALVMDGIAFAYRKYSLDYDRDEKISAIQGVGLHNALMQSPEQFRRARVVGRYPPDPACLIKGNISTRGTHIFHIPGQRYYEQTGIREDRGERWFCSEADARRAGWRKARR